MDKEFIVEDDEFYLEIEYDMTVVYKESDVKVAYDRSVTSNSIVLLYENFK